MDRQLKVATPLVLLALAGLAWFEPFLPGSGWLRQTFGETGILRIVTGLLALYLAMLVVERQRMEGLFTQTMGALKDFHRQLQAERAGGAASGGAAGPEPTPAQQDDAVRILIEALRSADPGVRRAAAENLQRLTGQDFGEDVEAWTVWRKRGPAGES